MEKVRIVEADNIADYLNRYYKKDRITPTLLQTYTEIFNEHGYISTSHHDNILGEFIARMWSFKC